MSPYVFEVASSRLALGRCSFFVTGRHLDPKVGAQQVVVVVSRVHGSVVLLIAGEAAKPSSIRVPSQTTVGLIYGTRVRVV